MDVFESRGTSRRTGFPARAGRERLLPSCMRGVNFLGGGDCVRTLSPQVANPHPRLSSRPSRRAYDGSGAQERARGRADRLVGWVAQRQDASASR